MRGDVVSPKGGFGPLIEIGPDDEENIVKAAAGRAHNVVCEMTHESCAFPGA